MSKLSHLDAHGAARMVDVSNKSSTTREASAEAIVTLSSEAFAEVVAGQVPKGDVFAAARIAGILAAKKTHELIPLCHQIPLAKASVDFEPLADRNAIRIIATAKTAAQTGVEMEALTAASLAALTIYDMVKAMDRGIVIESVRLLTKSGGKSGTFAAPPRMASASAKPAKRPALPMPESPVGATHGHLVAEREAFRAFMTDHRLRATEWAKLAGIPAAQIYAYLTGRSRALPQDTAEKLAKAARVRPEDMFARSTPERRGS